MKGSKLIRNSDMSHTRPYIAKCQERWWEAAASAVLALFLIFCGAVSFAGSFFSAGAELRFLLEGPEWESARGVVVKRDSQVLNIAGFEVAAVHYLTIDYVIQFGNCHHAPMASRSRFSCATRNHQWPHWWPQYLEGEIFYPQNPVGRDSGHPEEVRPNQAVSASPAQFNLGHSFRSVVPVDSSVSKQFSLGSAVSMHYPHAYPSEARLLTEKMDQRPVGWLKRMGGVLLITLVGIGFLAIGINLQISAFASCYRLFRLACHGRCAKAQIVDRWIDEGKDDEGGTYSIECVAYRFQPPSGAPLFAAEINSSAYNKLRIGGEVMVKFLPRQPQICRLLVRQSGHLARSSQTT